MSGGSMDYLYSKVEAARFKTDTPERMAFYKHLQLVADALHSIEWVDSGDFGPGSESEAIMKCITKTDRLAAVVIIANGALADLQKALASVTP